MARNINLKLNNLKINTYSENLYDNRSPINLNAKKIGGNNSSSKMSNINNIKSNYTNSHTSSTSQINELNNNSAGKKSSNSLINNNSHSNFNINTNSNSNLKINNISGSKYSSETDNNTNDRFGIRSNSKSGSLIQNQIKDERNVKLKSELNLEAKFYPDSFSPKSTKINLTNNKISSNSNLSNITPLSTRNNQKSLGTLVSPSKSNYNSNSNNININNNIPHMSINNDPSPNSGVEMINVMSLLSAHNNNTPITLKNLNANIPNYDSSKYSLKSMSVIKAYAANTHQGIIRTYNEDRVSIILNIIRPSNFTGDIWPKCSFFGIYDGHGGSSCADFLRDSLHQYDSYFPTNVKEAIRRGFEAAEKDFINTLALGKNGEIADRSGSCAIVTFIVNDMCYVANVGDSRAVLSLDSGREFNVLTNDHKPNEPQEKKRIVDNGGKVYQTQTPAKNFNITLNNVNSNQILVGPHRVFPGRLSVSRTFGDIEGKFSKFGGLPNVIISTPEITSFEIKSNMDFIVMGCDGIFDQLNSNEIIKSAWMTCEDNLKDKNIHVQCGMAIDMIIKTSLVRRTLDNVTCVIIAFSNFEKLFINNNQDNFINQVKEVNERARVIYEREKEKEKNIQPSPFNLGLQYNFNSTLENNNKIGDKKTTLHSKFDSYDEIHKHRSINLEIFKNGVVDNPNNPYGNNFNQSRKSYIQKKLVSLDLSSLNKKVINNNVLKPDKELSVKKKLDYSEHFEKDKKSLQSFTSDYHPSSTKNSKLEENGFISSIKKISSFK